MGNLPFRQIHLDFHTSGLMPDVGSEFTEESFEEALKVGHISSITLFAKCHHGYAYFPSKVNIPHPTMKTNLLDLQLKVCERLGVRTQIYISAGLDERKAEAYPHFRNISHGSENTLLGAHWHGLCFNNDEYLEMLKAEVAEVMETFAGRFNGIFMDICFPIDCVCPSCINSMIKAGLDPENPEHVKINKDRVFRKYTKAINDTVAKYDPDMPVIHNFGNIPRNNRDYAFVNTKHFELESLPTGGWGYDHFPLSAAYARTLGREFVGMTGKFHMSWGEFGGYKHPNALIYETALSLALGAKCNIGDQLHPSGKFDLATYRLVGKAFAEVEKREGWCVDAKHLSDIAIYTTYTDETRDTCPDIGANRMLLEGKYLYNIIDSLEPFDDYKLIIFPDSVVFDDALTEKVNAYLKKGGKLLLSYNSGTRDGAFFADFGATLEGESELDATYLVPTYDMKPNGIAPYLMYKKGNVIKASDNVKLFAKMENSYFNRSLRRFCSHRNTPNKPGDDLPGAFISGNIGYIAWPVFTDYGENGAYHTKRIVLDMLDALLGDDKTLETNLPSNGVVTLTRQEKENRLVNHLLYAVTKPRGNGIEIIEDAIPVYNTEVKIRLDTKPKRVYCAPEGCDIDFTYENGVLSYTLDSFTTHTMAVIDL
ncbi:MAG: beta-galactosidase trimerization domain-containing protein [Clostridia bacterium]|nr:beta-galactosidase trimerization domain-containing protein [Clostridia bacterium]